MNHRASQLKNSIHESSTFSSYLYIQVQFFNLHAAIIILFIGKILFLRENVTGKTNKRESIRHNIVEDMRGSERESEKVKETIGVR